MMSRVSADVRDGRSALAPDASAEASTVLLESAVAFTLRRSSFGVGDTLGKIRPDHDQSPGYSTAAGNGNSALAIECPAGEDRRTEPLREKI